MDPALDIEFQRHAAELRESWQARALLGTSGKLAQVVLSILAHNYDDAMPTLLRVVFPGFTSIQAPFFCSAGKIAKTGHVCADLITKDGKKISMYAIFASMWTMQTAFRRLADRLKLTDHERVEMFAALKRWVVADYRLDPNMDPRDPDAKRLVH